MTEREMFKQWVEREHAHILNGAELGDVRFRMDIDFMYMAWQASANREGYKLVPLQPSNNTIVAIERKVENQLEASGIDADPFRLDGEKIYKAMIGAVE